MKKQIAMLLMIIVITIVFTPIVMAKYNVIEILKSNNEIAKPIFVVEGSTISKINQINNIGYYEFSVKNFDETGISETGFIYTIQIICNKDDSIKIELYNEKQLLELQDLKTQEISIAADRREEQKYKLKVIYDNSLGTKGKEILDEVQIKVHSEQQK